MVAAMAGRSAGAVISPSMGTLATLGTCSLQTVHTSFLFSLFYKSLMNYFLPCLAELRSAQSAQSAHSNR